jgi:hypothetical protein
VLQQLEVLERRARVRQVLYVGRPRPVEEVGQVGDEGGLVDDLLRGEVVQVARVGEGLDELVGRQETAGAL